MTLMSDCKSNILTVMPPSHR